ncbi:hypothetical protein [Tessaracoccus antarcticus]|uniref:Hpt domain-containing protein n=1 Tax=Tessaracoccus antarcticus TaxID=2479848 RepID=A0A3M0G8P1_9ACTN|nr:hypothetical protein [Tessaracoccus antarcticus]RMB61345.1 hypothetical protein EAX62_01395 [Tessaracoccus antarcticus]
MIDDVAPQAADFISSRREAVARTAAQELRQASMTELPALTHRLAGKLGVFGYESAGDAARRLMLDLQDGVDESQVPGRVADIVALLDADLREVS